MKTTAEDFLWDKRHGNGFHDFELPNILIEFAKLHVEACKKEISEKAEIKEYIIPGIFYVDKDSILNAYPLENIK